MKLEWCKRARKDVTPCAKRRIWTTRCKKYRVVESKSTFGLPTIYYACRYTRPVEDSPNITMWDIISRHRKAARAFAACEQWHNAGVAR